MTTGKTLAKRAEQKRKEIRGAVLEAEHIAHEKQHILINMAKNKEHEKTLQEIREWFESDEFVDWYKSVEKEDVAFRLSNFFNNRFLRVKRNEF